MIAIAMRDGAFVNIQLLLGLALDYSLLLHTSYR